MVYMRKIIVAELNMTKAEHLSFNSCILDELKNQYHIKFYCQNAHSSLLSDDSIDDIDIHNVYVVAGKNRNFIRKFAVEVFNAIKIIITNKNSSIVFLSAFPPALVFIALFAKIVNCDVNVFLHGELKGLRGSSKITSYSFWIKFYFKSGLYKSIKNIVIGKHIYNEIIKFPYMKDVNLHFINHPISIKNNIKIKTIEFASIGYARGKIYDDLFSVINKSEKKFHHIGMVSDEIYNKFYDSNIVFHVKPGDALSQTEYIQLLSKVKFSVFYYNDDYALTTSGAMLDAVSCSSVIITLRNVFAEYLKTNCYPVIVCNDTEDIVDLLNTSMDYLNEIEKNNICYAQGIFKNVLQEVL